MPRTVVALSGGVDSATVAGLLHEAGHEVIGVHMKLHRAGGGHARACCGVDDAHDARAVCDRLCVPFYVLDLEDAFERAVLAPFVDAYAAGATPNPCVACNGVLKFRVLLARAVALGADHLATGHYARLDGGRLYQARDADKDQSYFLWPLSEAARARLLFPLGDLTKSEVRAHAARLGLAVADKPESMDVCFLPGGTADRMALLRARHPDLDASGVVVDEHGREVGSHDGFWRFTIGQRKGLGGGADGPRYVTAIDAATRRVTVGPRDALRVHEIVATGLSWLRRPPPERVVRARLRHRGPRLAAQVLPDVDGATPIHLLEPAEGVAPGQSVVVYDGDEVLGGGTIRAPRAAGTEASP